jgi:hypothetical protein
MQFKIPINHYSADCSANLLIYNVLSNLALPTYLPPTNTRYPNLATKFLS